MFVVCKRTEGHIRKILYIEKMQLSLCVAQLIKKCKKTFPQVMQTKFATNVLEFKAFENHNHI